MKLYSLQGFELSPPEEIYANPSVTGIAFRTRQVKDLTYLIKQLQTAAAHNKKASIYIAPPESMVMGNPWNPVFVAEWAEVIRHVGETVAAEVPPGVLTHTRGSTDAVTNGWSLTGPMPVGYSSKKLIDAMKKLGTAFMTYFPDSIHWAAVGAVPYDTVYSPTYVAKTISEWGFTTYGQRFGVWRENLTSCVPPPPPPQNHDQWIVVHEHKGPRGAQMIWSVQDVGDPPRMNMCAPTAEELLHAAVLRGIEYGMDYQEIYRNDFLDPRLTELLASLNDVTLEGK